MLTVDVIEVDAPVSGVYHVLLDHLKRERDVRIKRLSEPSLIEARVGSWTSRRGNPPGIVKLEMHPESEKTCIDFTFDFAAWFAAMFVLAVISNIICFAIRWTGGVATMLVTVFIFFWIMPKDVRTQKKKVIGRVRDFLKMQAKKLN